MEKGSPEVGEAPQLTPPSGLNIGISISILDVVLRVVVLLGTLVSAVAMATTEETLFTSQFTVFTVEYDDLPALSFFVIANSVVCAYLAFSIPLAIFHIIRHRATYSRLILIFFDTVMLGLLIAGASAASAIVDLAHKGNTSANWPAICQQYNNLCERISGFLIGSFIGIFMLMLLVVLSALSLSRH